MEAFWAIVAVDSGELEATYDRLSRVYKRAEDQANETWSRGTSVKWVSRDLFNEWESELSDYSDAGLRRASERQLRETRQRYDVLADTMDAATTSMDPVLTAFSISNII